MSHVRSLLSALMALVGPFSLVFLGGGIALALIHNGEMDTDGRAELLRSGRATVSDDGDTVDVKLDVAKGDALTKLVVRSEEGKELATLHVHVDGAIRLESIENEPISFVMQNYKFKYFGLGLSAGRNRFTLRGQPDGSADLLVEGSTDKRPYRMRITSEGNVLPPTDVPAL